MTTPARQGVRVRFAPSPTGSLHIGGLRTALYNYLIARRQGGAFILRIEDTDQERYVPGAEEEIIEALRWAGIRYDEGPDVGGAFGPYRQTERTELYKGYVQTLIDRGRAYYAFDTKEELDAMRQRLQQEGVAAPKYDAGTRGAMRNALSLPPDEVARLLGAGLPYVVRLKVPEDEDVRFEDVIRGEVTFNTSVLDDQVLVKSDGLPTYHLANVVDDHLMRVTLVIRGEEWLPSTPKHILLYRYLGWEPPRMAHLPLILSPTGGKLSKRNAGKACIPILTKDYIHGFRPGNKGSGTDCDEDSSLPPFEPEALVNFLVLLGWNPGTEQELFSLDELVGAFSLDRVGAAGVQFSLDKLKWFNQQYLRQLSPAELARRARRFVDEEGYTPTDADLERIAAMMQERVEFAADLATECRYFFEAPTAYDENSVKKRWKPDSGAIVTALAGRLGTLQPFEAGALEAALHAFVEEQEVGMGRVMAPVRLALSGVPSGPGLYDMMAFMGREETMARLHRAAAVLG